MMAALAEGENIHEQSDDESFIVLGSSPCLGMSNSMDTFMIENANANSNYNSMLKDMSDSVNIALKKVEGPSPASLMTASTIVTEDKSTEELQRSFGEILDENVILKDTLKQNNQSMKSQLMLIASCQEDMLKTHTIHHDKFQQTKELIERLRQENKVLKQKLAEAETRAASLETQPSMEGQSSGRQSSGPSSAVEFVSSPDDDTIHKLTAQLDLVEKQRREIILDNKKLSWQRESLEHMIDVTSKERDDLREKVNNLEISNTELQAKVVLLQQELAQAKVKLMESEGLRMEISKMKSENSDTIKVYKEQIYDLTETLRKVQTTKFKPVRQSVPENGSDGTVEYANYLANLNTYDQTLKHLADFFNNLIQSVTQSLLEAIGSIQSLHEYKLHRNTVDEFKRGLARHKKHLDTLHNTILCNTTQIKGMLKIFEGMFNDYNEVLKKSVDIQLEISRQKLEKSELTQQYQRQLEELSRKSEDGSDTASRVTQTNTPNIKALTNALLARSEEVQSLKEELKRLRNAKDDVSLLKAQLELYKCDFDMEREAREKMAAEKDNLELGLKAMQRKHDEVLAQLEELGRLAPEAYSRMRRAASSAASTRSSHVASTRSSHPSRPEQVTLYTCPKCMSFKTNQYKVMEDHIDYCLDDF